jgi:hypothetical protein
MLTHEITLVYPEVQSERLEITLVTATGTEPISADATTEKQPLKLEYVPVGEEPKIEKGQPAPHFRHHFALCTAGLNMLPILVEAPTDRDPVGILFTCLNAQAAPETAGAP